MRKARSKGTLLKVILHTLGILLSVIPPAVCTLTYFPLWQYSPEKALAGGTLLLLLLSAYPIFKLIRAKLASPASYFMWLIIFLLFFILSKIADEMTVISFFGFIGNLLGAVCFKLAGDREARE